MEEGTHSLKNCTFFIILSILCFAMNQVESTTYTVGDTDGWSTGINYMTWAQKYNFSVGDVLVFNYVSRQHNVFQVTQSTFRSCNSSTGVLNAYESGNDHVTLTEAKSYWFICDVPGHCLGGMKFGVEVKGAEAHDSPPDASPDNSGRRSALGKFAWIVLLALGLLI